MVVYIGTGADEPSQDSERAVANALRTLPDDWTVLHHVSWQSRRGGREGDGEADFILINPSVGGLVLEVKGGDIEIRNGRWFSTDRFNRVHEIKNPFEQATSSKHALLKWLANEDFSNRLGLGHAVVFPHMENLPPLGPSATPAITWAAGELRNPCATLDRAIQHWGLRSTLTASEAKKIVSLLAPTVTVRRSLASRSKESEDQLIQLTAEQIEAFAGLRARRGGLILGGAGTGKTVLAIARAQQLGRVDEFTIGDRSGVPAQNQA